MELKKHDSSSHAYKIIVVISKFPKDCFVIFAKLEKTNTVHT